MVKEVKNKLNLAVSKVKQFAQTNKVIAAGQKALIGVGFFALTPFYAYASGNGNMNNAFEMVDNLVSIVCTIFGLIGSLLLVWAIGQLVMAFKSDDADSKSRAMQVLIVSVLLCSTALIYRAVTGLEVVDVNIGV